VRLLHYSEAPLQIDEREYVQCVDYKPEGLWLSVQGEYDWEWWCRNEAFGLDRLAHPNLIVLAPSARLLWLSTPSQIQKFTRRYAVPSPAHRFIVGVDWSIVVEDYQGIVIAPYQWKCRHSIGWYYTWDCASGCIWDLKAIDCVERCEEVAA
jgi:hypothetical protein